MTPIVPQRKPTNERARAQILVMFADQEHPPTLKELKLATGAASDPALAYHFKCLINEGLMVRKGRGHCALTKQGQSVAAYLQVISLGENCYRRAVRQTFGAYTRMASRAVRLAAQELDAVYAVDREGLRLRTGHRKGELERKATGADILKALRKSTTQAEAARLVGLQAGALHQRLQTILDRAKRLLKTDSGCKEAVQ